MKIVDIKKVENCFDGDFVFKYLFDAGWTHSEIIHMEMLGDLRYYQSFPRPMFQVTCSDGTVIKGVENDPECRIIFPRENPTSARKNFEARFG
ncbi:MAG: hypothetical protein FWF88_00155 [Peptococcaceae bacterium]|nr:hypothetical protein [Peptococcaceae bacterium]